MSRQSVWFHRLLHGLAGRPRCTHLATLLARADAPGRDARADLALIIRRTTGRELSPFVMGDHSRWQSLTDFLDRGATLAASLIPHVSFGDAVLEYGGGLGRVGRAVVPHVRRLVSVDADPMAGRYGPALGPGVEFMRPDDLPATPAFDGAYAIDGLRNIAPDRLRGVLDYVHCRLKPGGWFLVDLAATGADLERFRALHEPLFSGRRVPLANAGFLLHKKDAATPAPDVPVDGRYTVNDGPVVADVLEGEVVVVNLDTGAYYIMQGTASVIWQMLAGGQPVPAVIEAFSSRHPGQAPAIGPAVTEFVAQLVEEQLLVPDTMPGAVPGAATTPGLAADPAAAGPFEAPAMFRYTDMQALIQMDPIREFDETGWPVRRQPASAARKG